MPQVLRNLIDDRLKLQEAKRTGVKVNPADVEKRIDALAQRNNMTRDELERLPEWQRHPGGSDRATRSTPS